MWGRFADGRESLAVARPASHPMSPQVVQTVVRDLFRRVPAYLPSTPEPEEPMR